MTYLKSSIIALGAGLGFTFAAQAHPVPKASSPTAENEVADHKHEHIHPKPGASLAFSHSVSGTLSAGDTAIVEVQVRDSYSGGSMVLEAASTSGVEVFGPGKRMVKDMATPGTHIWLIDFEVETDGVFYIPIIATVEPDVGMKESRSYAARIEVGDWKAAQASKEASKSLRSMPSGETAHMLVAEEIIE